jgi:hypothetical protein
MSLSYISTRRLLPIENGIFACIYLTAPEENSSDEVRQLLQAAIDDGYAGMKPCIEQGIANGKVTAA